MTLMRNRSFTSGMAVATGFFAAVSGIMLVLSLFWQIGEDFSRSEPPSRWRRSLSG